MLGFHVVVVLFSLFVNNADHTQLEQAHVADSPSDCADASNVLRVVATKFDYTLVEATCQGVYVADDGSSYTVGHEGE